MKRLDIVRNLLEKLNSNGIKAYLVGGAVRDYLLGKEFKDLDVAYVDSKGVILEVLKIYKPNLVGIEYGGIKLEYEGEYFELTHFRNDVAYLDNRHPIIEKTSDIMLDARRRDFTINAMYLDKDLKLIDPLNGKLDLERKVIRTCKDADTSFKEDSLRMLRAIKFSKRFNYELEQEVKEAIVNNNSLLINSINSLKGDLDEILTYSGLSDLLVFDLFKNKKEELAFIEENKLSLEDSYLILELRKPLGLTYNKSFNKVLKRILNLINNYNVLNIYQNYDIIDKVSLVQKFLGLEELVLVIKKKEEIEITSSEILSHTKKLNSIYRILEEEILSGRLENKHDVIYQYLEQRKWK